MNIKGKVVSVLPVQSGEGKNGKWSKSPYVIEIPGDYPKKVCVTIWGDKLPVLTLGSEVDCSIEVESKEFNSKWYTEVKCWKVDVVSGAPKTTTTTAGHPATASSGKAVPVKAEEDFSSFENAPADDSDNLPF